MGAVSCSKVRWTARTETAASTACFGAVDAVSVMVTAALQSEWDRSRDAVGTELRRREP